MKKKYLGFFLFFSSILSGQSLKQLYDLSLKSYEAKDYSAFLIQTKALDSLRPCHPKFTYNLAIAYALNQQNDAAVELLEKIVLMNNSVSFEQDADFKSIQNLPQYKKVLTLKKKLNDTISNSLKQVSLNEKELHPEGLLILNDQKLGLAASIRKRKIVAFDLKTGQCNDWLKKNDMLAVFSMKVDAKNEFLWVATAAIPEMENYTKELQGKAEVLQIAIKTKEIVKRYTTEGSHVFGDLVVTKNDVVYISDSNKPIVYKIEKNQLTEWLNLETEAFNLQGITLNASEEKLFVADYLKGILTVSIKERSKKWMQFPKGTTQKGIDGLTFYNNSLIAIHNGVTPIRIVRYFLNKDQNQFDSFSIVDHNRKEFREPVLGTLSGNSFYFFCNSPWNAYDKNFELNPLLYTNPILFSYNL